MNSFLSAVVAVLVATLVAIQAIPLIAPARTSPKYEYLIKDIPDATFEAEMDKIGDGGWEMIFGRRAMDDKVAGYELIFRRPK